MKIALTKLKLQNFRNIDYAEHTFGERSAICGTNRIGKTNTLEAINYLLTDTLIYDTNNLPSIKPLHDTKLEVVVEGTFLRSDGVEFKLTKKYGEDWVKTRGEDITVMKGHYTRLYINDIEYKTAKDYLAAFNELIGISNITLKAKIDLLRAVMNHRYLTDAEWKLFREFIIELVGDVTDEDVYKMSPQLRAIQTNITLANGKIDVAIKSANQKVAQAAENVNDIKAVIKDLESKTDVDAELLTGAKMKIEELDEQISSLKSNKPENVSLKKIEQSITNLKLEIAEQITRDHQECDVANKQINVQIESAEFGRNEIAEEYQKTQNELRTLESSVLTLQSKLSYAKSRKENLVKEREGLRIEFDKVLDSVELVREDACPACGYVLNSTDIETKKQAHEIQKNSRLDAIEARGESINVELGKLDHEIGETNKDLSSSVDKIPALKKQIEAITEKGKSISFQISELRLKLKPFEESFTIKSLRIKLAELETNKTQSVQDYREQNSTIEAQIYEINESKKEYTAIVDKHKYYLQIQNDIISKKQELDKVNRNLTIAEEEQILLKQFMKTKLSMLDENVSKIFGDIKFKLIQENIKAGSWEEVCEPYILGKSTLFHNGSTSEKIVTGIAIIEKIKAAKGIADLPILFDEGEALDSATIANLLEANSQIICAKVDDNYSQPIVKELK